MKLQKIFTVAALIGAAYYSVAQNNNIAEEVVWVVGDEPIYKSQVEEQYSQMQYERVPIEGDPYCVIPEQLAINKLFLHQAEIDTIVVEVTSDAGSECTYQLLHRIAWNKRKS